MKKIEFNVKYDATYYGEVYSGFDDPKFALEWALSCLAVMSLTDGEFDSTLEFGAGLGQNLIALKSREKWAVDVSDKSRDACRIQGIRWENNLINIPDDKFDLIISRHSLEHVHSPFETLTALRNKLLSSGRFLLVIPLEDASIPMDLSNPDPHQHLYSWTPTTIRNLLITSGFTVNKLWIHNGIFFKRTVRVRKFLGKNFLKLRKFLSLIPIQRSPEIIVDCSTNLRKPNND